MTDFSEIKKIGKDCTLELRGHALSEGAAEAFNRPAGSYEFCIELRHKGRYVTHTHPSASHLFTKEQYAEIFNAIKSPSDYFRAHMNLHFIRTNENAEPMSEKNVAGIVDKYSDSVSVMQNQICVLEEVIDKFA